QARVAEDQSRYRLDTSAGLQVSGLGRTVPDAFEQFGTFGAFTVFVGVELAIPLDNAFEQSAADRAVLAVRAAEEQRRAERERLRTELALQLETVDEAFSRMTLATRTAALAQENVDVITGRFQAGDATAFDVVQAIQSRREAELRAARAQVDIASAQTRIDDLRGALLERVALQCGDI